MRPPLTPLHDVKEPKPICLTLAARCHHTATMVKLSLRVPDDIHEELAKAAGKSMRSLNAEIVYRLAGSLTFEKEFIIAANRKAIGDWLAEGKKKK
jgi:hypothetical protein